MTAPLLKAKNLAAAYAGRLIFSDLNFSLQPGQFLGVLGPNGCGKTTLLRCLGKTKQPTKGAIYISGQNIARLSLKNFAQRLASASHGGPRSLTLRQYVLLGRFPWLSWLGFYTQTDHEIVDQLLCDLALSAHAQQLCATLSDGQWQLATLARALTQLWQVKTPILLLDEPAANLDVNRRMEIFQLLAKWRKKGGAIIAAMHDCNLASLFCDSLLGIKDGRQLFYGAVKNVFTKENLSAIYDWPVGIFSHPDADAPQIYPHLPFSHHNLAASARPEPGSLR